MIHFSYYTPENLPEAEEEEDLVHFLFKELESYGDPEPYIQKAIDYALGRDSKLGGLVLVAKQGNKILSTVVVNKTGMSDYIPENILVYIATDTNQRGKGIGKKTLEEVIAHTQGNIALHVDIDNPAIRLYEKLGFTKEYVEMRLVKPV